MSAQKLSTGMPEVFENESSFVRRKLSLEMSAAIGTNVLQAGVRAGRPYVKCTNVQRDFKIQRKPA